MRVNRQIRISPVRLIDDNGQQVGIVPVDEALKYAEQAGLDLVEVSPTARPPVCRVMDYGKFKYEMSKKARTARKNRHAVQIKEIKMRPEISDHDFDFKVKHAIEFLGRGDKVKFTMVFRGREALHKDIGRKVLERVKEVISDTANVESDIRDEGRTLTMIATSK